MNDLVERLTAEQRIVAGGPNPSAESFKAAIDRGYVHCKFTETRGGTELGIRLENDRSDWSGADFEAKEGPIKIVGTLTLNYVKVRFVGKIDLASLEGTGHLEVLGEVEPGAAA
jgi:hypothetical protein